MEAAWYPTTPQARVNKFVLHTRDFLTLRLEIQLAVARNIGRGNTVNGVRVDPGDSGEDACLPSLQGRTAISFPLFGKKRTTIGVSGHWGNEEIDTDAFDTNERICSWSANLDVSMPVNNWFAFKGELYTGSDLDSYLGGIGQGVNMATLKPIKACGGWGAVSLGPWDKWRFNVGASVEAVEGDDLTADGARTLNRSIFGNVIYQINKNASFAFEISHWHTEYKNLEDGENLRIQTALMYKF